MGYRVLSLVYKGATDRKIPCIEMFGRVDYHRATPFVHPANQTSVGRLAVSEGNDVACDSLACALTSSNDLRDVRGEIKCGTESHLLNAFTECFHCYRYCRCFRREVRKFSDRGSRAVRTIDGLVRSSQQPVSNIYFLSGHLLCQFMSCHLLNPLFSPIHTPYG